MADQNENNSPMLNNKTYDLIKFLAQILLPALGTLYFALAGLWDLPKAEEVVGTVVAVDAFLGALLLLSTKSYNASDAPFDGDLVVTDDGAGNTVMGVALNDHPEAFVNRDTVVFKVKNTE